MKLLNVVKKLYNLEDNFIDLAFELGPVEGMEPNDIKKYIRYIADWRLNQLKLDPVYKIKEHPLPWLREILNGVEHMQISLKQEQQSIQKLQLKAVGKEKMEFGQHSTKNNEFLELFTFLIFFYV